MNYFDLNAQDVHFDQNLKFISNQTARTTSRPSIYPGLSSFSGK